MRLTLPAMAMLGLCCLSAPQDTDAAEPALHDDAVDFVQDVQPILRRHCYRCHGSQNQEANLRLNRRAAAFGEADSGETIIVPHDPEAGLLIKRLVDEDHGDLMPLDGQPLTQTEIGMLRAWISQGASWPDAESAAVHWAYRPIARPQVPIVIDAAASPIDQFVAKRRQQQGLEPSAPADRARLIRRVSLALVGVPPTVEEVDAFLNDHSADAYEKVVDRLLSSERYGERWAVPWLDLARYADSNGFQADQIRDNWAYRDWVIRAFNSDMPFDQFVIEQIAGDLLPDASSDQRIATGFHRMTTCNVEAGVHPEANRINQIVDRVNTTATVFLGTTLECAQCHDHKYDPFTQRDYYQIFAYFNNTPLEVRKTAGVTWDFYGPTMDLPLDTASQSRQQELTEKLAALQQTRRDVADALHQEFNDWVERIREASAAGSRWKTVAPQRFETSDAGQYEILDDGAVLLSGNVPGKVEYVFAFAHDLPTAHAIRIEALTDDRLPGNGPGRGDNTRSNFILSEVHCELVTAQSTTAVPLTDPRADYSQPKWHVSKAIDGDRKTGWAIAPQFGKPHWAQFRFEKPFDFADGQLRVTLVQHYGQGRVIGKPRVSLFVGDPVLYGCDEATVALANKKTATPADRNKLRAAFESRHEQLSELDQQMAATKQQLTQLQPDTTLVMVEMDERRATHVLKRGDYEAPGEQVQPATPGVLPKAKGVVKTADRLELARWLTCRENPLLARVTVNRWWAAFFQKGIVMTLEDFGSQAEAPSHPALLDWLAAELIESGWSMKHVHKQIVMSATFQQSVRVTPDLLARDPNNRWLARGPRMRLSAELIRDNALAISGLLSSKMYGPPVMPYQPDNVWRSVGRNQPKWKSAEGEDRFRRGVYVIWKRAAPYPSFMNFDAPDRSSCTVSRARTNTPLQALTLLNDPAYAEMALAYADRILRESPDTTDESRIRYAVRLAVAREARPEEIKVLKKLLDDERRWLATREHLVKARVKVPFAGMRWNSDDSPELAAWFAVASTLLNLDETMSL